MASQQQYCLKWNNHQTNLQRVFARLLRNEIFTDVTLACEGHALQAHKLVLSACSSYFEHLFTMHPDKAPLVILKDIKYEDIKAIVEFMYQGEINISQEQLPSLIRTAETLKVKGLAEVSTGSDASQQQQRLQQQQAAHQQHNFAQQLQQQVPVSGVPSAIPMAMVAASMAEAPELMKQVQRQRALAPQPLPSMLPMMGMQKTWGGQMLEQQQRATADFNPVISSVAGNAGMEESGAGSGGSGSNSRDATRDIPENYSNIPKLEEFLQSSQPKENFWKADTTKYVLAEIRDRKIDLRTGAEILGVSYNTIYGRYREAHGLLSDSPIAASQARAAAAAQAQAQANAQAAAASPGAAEQTTKPRDGKLSEKMTPTEFGSVIQMNDYVNSGGSRPTFWDLDATKAIMEAIRDKTIEMKHAAEILGVSYGTLYGRYRENYGYLKANWKQSSRRIGAGSLWEEPQTLELLRRVNTGEVSVNDAAEKLGVDYYVLQYQLNLMDMAGGTKHLPGAADDSTASLPAGMLQMAPQPSQLPAATQQRAATGEEGNSGAAPAATLAAQAKRPAGHQPPSDKRPRLENGANNGEMQLEESAVKAEPAASGAGSAQEPAGTAATEQEQEPAPAAATVQEPPATEPEPAPANGSAGHAQ